MVSCFFSVFNIEIIQVISIITNKINNNGYILYIMIYFHPHTICIINIYIYIEDTMFSYIMIGYVFWRLATQLVGGWSLDDLTPRAHEIV